MALITTRSGKGAPLTNAEVDANFTNLNTDKVETSDPRLSDSREWAAATVTQAEAEEGTATTRRAWTAQRVAQAIAAWWNRSSAKTKLDGIESGAQVNTVVSVAGKIGAVSLSKADVGLSNVDNTSDANKPISTATQTALNAKENTIAAGTTSQYWRGDKTWQTLNAAAITDSTAVGRAVLTAADAAAARAAIGAPATDMADMSHTAIMQALGLARLANTSIDALRYGPYQQQGELFIRNRGVIAGCAITKSTTAARNLHIGAGQCFAGGNVFTVAQQGNAASVPPNTGGTAVMVSAYLYPHSSGTYKLAVTAIGQNVPDNGIEIYRLTIPANNTNATDPYLASVTITDVRRIEPMYPDALDNPPSVSLVFARPMRGTDWRMDIDVVSSTGAPCRADQIVITNRANNGCTLWLASAADDVRIRWQATRLHD